MMCLNPHFFILCDMVILDDLSLRNMGGTQSINFLLERNELTTRALLQ